MSRKRPTLIDKAIEMIDGKITVKQHEIKWLQTERAELLELQARASRATPAPKTSATLKERIEALKA